MPLELRMMTCRRPMLLLLLLLLLAVVCSMASGVVHNLGDADFDEFIDNLPQETLLLVDFFKPTCRACQRLSPVLDYLEDEWEREEPDPSKRWFKLAKVDVDKNPRLKNVFGVRRIPDLRFVRAGQWGTYTGGRLIEDIKEFKERMALVPLRFVGEEELVELARDSEAVFVLSADPEADPASVAPGVLLAATLAQHITTFCTTSPEVLSSLGLGVSGVSPALVKVVAAPTGVGRGPGGRQLLQPAVYNGSGGGEGDAKRVAGVASASSWAVSSWMEKERFGLVSELSADNFSRLGSLGRLMVLGVIDRHHEATASFEQTFAKLAARFGVKHADKLIFGTVNREQMTGFVETFNIYEGRPRVVVMDMPADVFYTVENMRLEEGEIEAFLIDVVAGYIPARVPSTHSARYAMKIWWLVQNGGAWSFLLLIPLVGLLWVFCDTPAREEAREALWRARQSEKQQEEKEKEKEKGEVEATARLKTD